MASSLGPGQADDLDPINQSFLQDFEDKHAVPEAISKLGEKLDGYKQQFNHYDEDMSGDLDMNELQQLMEGVGLGKTRAELLKLVSIVDDDNSGTIRYSEFVNLMLIEEQILSEPVECKTGPIQGKVKGHKAKRRGAQKKVKRGHVHMTCSITEGKGGYTLAVVVKEGRSLLAMDYNGFSDPYVKLYLDPTGTHTKDELKRKTKVQKKTLNPTWNETLTYDSLTLEDLGSMRLLVTMWDWDRLSRNDFMGALSWTLKEIHEKEVSSDGWFVLLDKDVGQHAAIQSRSSDLKSSGSASAAVGRACSGSVTSVQDAYSERDFVYLKLIGCGSFGKVFLAEEKKTKKRFAIKVLKKLAVIENDDLGNTMTERDVLAMPEHPFLATMFAAFQSDAFLFFVMTPIAGGDLMFHVLARQSFPEITARFYTAETVVALAFLHNQDIIYRDLKLDNVMLDQQGHVKLADFGLAKQGINLVAGQKTETFCGTLDYLAPEIVEYKPYTHSVDWWALGVMLFEMLTGEAPFDGDNEDALFRSICKQKIRFPRWCKTDTVELLRGLLNRDPDKRLGSGPSGIEEVKKQKFFRSISWGAAEDRNLQPPIVPKKNMLQNFDQDFTSKAPKLTPQPKSEVAKIDQSQFAEFDFVRQG